MLEEEADDCLVTVEYTKNTKAREEMVDQMRMSHWRSGDKKSLLHATVVEGETDLVASLSGKANSGTGSTKCELILTDIIGESNNEKPHLVLGTMSKISLVPFRCSNNSVIVA